MTVFVDTSAVFALLDKRDENHSLALQRRAYLISPDIEMMTSNYVVVETCALLQRRIGLDAIETFREEILPLMAIQWITAEQHERALSALLSIRRRKLSLVDCVSFEIIRDNRWRMAFAFDQHFTEQGFDCEIPILRSN